MTLLPPVIATLLAKTDQFTADLGKARGEMAKTTSTGEKAFHGLAAVGKAALIGLAGGAIAVGAESLHMADQYQTAHARLVVALKSAGSSWDEQKAKIDAVSSAATRFGENQSQVEDALAIMVRGMGSSSKAIKEFGLAQDLAAAKGIDLSQAALLVTKASEGQIRPIKMLGLDLPFAAAGAAKLAAANTKLTVETAAAVKVHEAQAIAVQHVKDLQDEYAAGSIRGASALSQIATAQKAATTASDRYTIAVDKIHVAQGKVNTLASTGQGILDALAQKLGGSAAAQADTFKGKVDALKAQLDDLWIKIGLHLIPILEKLATITINIINWMEKHKAVAITLAVVVGGVLVAAITAWAVSLFLAGGALAFLISPITLVVIGIAALAAGVVYLWTHWNQIWTWISQHKAYAAIIAVLVPIIPAILALVAAARYLSEHWAAIWSGIQTTITDAAAVIGAVAGFFQRLPAQIADGWDTAKNAVVGAWQAILAAVADGYQAVLGFFERLPGDAVNLLTRLPGMLERLAVLAMHGFVDTLKLQFKLALAFFIGIPTLILLAIGDLNRLLIKTGGQVIQGLWQGAQIVWAATLKFFEALPGRIVAGVGDLIHLLFAAGSAVIRGLWNGAVVYFTQFLPWVASIPGKIIAALPGAARWLWTVGIALIQGLFAGAEAAWSGLVGWLAGIPSAVVHAIGDVGNLLADIGKQIVHSLWDGMKSVWHDVTGWLGGLGGAIKHLKGPPEVDAVLLYGNGMLIMGGFRSGLAEGWRGVQSDLGEMTAHIGAAKFPALNFPRTGSPTSLGIGGAFHPAGPSHGDVHIHIDARGSVGLDENKLGRVLEDVLARHGKKNGGLQLKIAGVN